MTHSIVGGAEDLDGTIIAQLEELPHLMERGKLFPAGPHSTRTGDTVALACGFEAIFHSLWKGKIDR